MGWLGAVLVERRQADAAGAPAIANSTIDPGWVLHRQQHPDGPE